MIITDEILNAYLDGELSVDDIAEVAAQIKKSSELAKRIENMRLNDKSIAETYHAIDTKPMPDSIMEMLEEFPESQKTVLPFRKKTSVRASAPIWQMAIAASIMLFIGLGTGRYIMPSVSVTDISAGIIGPENTLYAVLENQPSAIAVALTANNDTLVIPSMTFRTSDNSYCREYIVTTQKSSTQNVACRIENNWVVKLSVGAQGKLSPESGLYQTASQTDNPLINSYIQGLMMDDALSAEDEALIMQKNWQ